MVRGGSSMNVLVISTLYPSKTNSMLGIFVRKQVAALKKYYGDEIEMKVISPVPYTPYILSLFSSKYKNYYNIPKKDIIDGIEIYYPRVLFLPRNLNFEQAGELCYRKMKKLVAKIHSDFKFDLMNAHVAFPSGYAAMLLNDVYKVPLVVTIHGQDINYTIKQNEVLRKKLLSVLDCAHKVMFVSKKLKKDALNYTKDNPKFEVIYNGVELEDVCDYENNIKAKYPNKRILFSAGNLIKTKGNHLTIQAFAHLCKKHKDLIFLIAGSGEEEQNLRELSKECGVEDKVLFLGQLSHREVMEYMQACELFVLPSYAEGFGVVYIEAMVNGKCVIGCQGEGIQDVIEDFKDGILVRPNDLEDLTNKLEVLFNNPNLIQEIGENAEIKIKENYTLEKSVQKVMKIYNTVLKEKN